MDKVGLSGKYQAYPEYKDSGVIELGEVPSGWQVTRIKHSAELTPKKPILNRNRNCSFVPMEKLKTDSITLDEIKPIDEVYDGYTFFLDDDILIAKVTPCFENKNIAIARSLVNGIGFGSSEIYVLRCRANVFIRFLFYRLQEDGFMEIAIGDMTGAGGLKRVPSTTISNYFYAAPSYQEQQKIANFLDHETAKIDTLIDKQQQLIKLLKEKRQAVISNAVTKGLDPDVSMRDSGVEWLGEVPEGWDVVPIKHIVEIPVTDGPHETPNFIDEGVPFISAEAVSSGKIDFKKIRAHISEEDNERYSLKYSPKIHDIYMVKSGATTGVTAIVETHVNFNIWSPLAVIRCKEDSSPYFVLNFMRSINFQEAVELNWSFGTQQNIGMGVIENLIVTKPPLVEAIEIVENLKIKFSLYDSVIGKALNQIDLMQERRTALISAAVTGKIDVRDWVAPEPSNNKIDTTHYESDVELNTEADFKKEASL